MSIKYFYVSLFAGARKKVYFLNLAPRQYFSFFFFDISPQEKVIKLLIKKWEFEGKRKGANEPNLHVRVPIHNFRHQLKYFLRDRDFLLTIHTSKISCCVTNSTRCTYSLKWTIHENKSYKREWPEEEEKNSKLPFCSNPITTKWRQSVSSFDKTFFTLHRLRRTSSWCKFSLFLISAQNSKYEKYWRQTKKPGRLVIEASINDVATASPRKLILN